MPQHLSHILYILYVNNNVNTRKWVCSWTVMKLVFLPSPSLSCLFVVNDALESWPPLTRPRHMVNHHMQQDSTIKLPVCISKKCLYLKGRERKCEKMPIGWFTPQMPAVVGRGVVLDWSQEQKSMFPIWVERNQQLGHRHGCLEFTLAVRWSQELLLGSELRSSDAGS